jgi:hypothetical protein
MALLLYSILHECDAPRVPPLRGADGEEAVSLVADSGLAAAVSRAPEATGAPTVRTLEEYAAVVAALHRQVSLLPVRYGCLFSCAAELKHLLHERRSRLLASLEAVDGCSEMTVRVVSPEHKAAQGSSCRAEAARPANSGATYLHDRGQHYADRDTARQRVATWAETLRAVLEGLFVTSKTDCVNGAVACFPAGTAAVHFLVKNEQLQAFREAAGDVKSGPGLRLFLTGPWPPYNFAEAPVSGGRDLLVSRS